MMHALGLLQDPSVVEKHPRDFVTGYAQQAGKQTEEIFKESLGKVLFIDEAYTLLNEDPRGEVIGTICALMTAQQYKGKLVVVLAGYDYEIAALLGSNPGLRSRFPLRVPFRAWDVAMSCKVLMEYFSSRDMVLEREAGQNLALLMREFTEAPNWSSGRDVLTWGKALYGKVEFGAPVSFTHLRATLHDLIATKRAMNVPSVMQQSQLMVLPSAGDRQSRLAPVVRKSTLTAAAVEDEPATAAAADVVDDDEEGDIWAPLSALGIDLDTIDIHDPALLDSLLQQGLAADAARQLLAQWEAYVAELARLAEEERLRLAAEERRRLELEEAARQAAEEGERRRLAEEARLIGEEQARQQAIQARLARMGNCEAGYAWVRQGGGWRCSAGGHYVSDGSL